MRIPLDESLPRQLIRLLPGHEVRTVAAMAWAGIRNGPLLQLVAGEFDAFLTADQTLEHQQDLDTLPLPSSCSSPQAMASKPFGHCYPPCFESVKP